MKRPKAQRPALAHGAWALVTISTYLVGSFWGRPPDERESRAVAAGSAREQPSGENRPSALGRGARDGAKPDSPRFRAAVGGRGVEGETEVPMDIGKIDQLVRSAVRSPNPLERRLAFAQVLRAMESSTLTAEQAMGVRRSMIENGASGAQWKLFDYAWGAKYPQEAIAHLDEIAAEHHDSFLGDMIPGLASENPQAAIELFGSLEAELQGKIRPRFLEGLVDNDIAIATDYLYDSRDPENPNWRPMDQLAREIEKDRGLDEALAWAADLPEGRLRSNAWSAAYAVWGKQDPQAAVQSIIEMPPSADRDQAINGFTAAYAGENGESAAIWAAEIQSPGMREAAMIRAGTQFFNQDEPAARSWFASSGLPPTALSQMGQPN